MHKCLTLKNVNHSYPDRKPVLRNLSVTLHRGEIMSLVGANGSGKTTLINLIAGFLEPESGTVQNHKTEDGLIFSSVVFQDSNLLGWKTAFANIEISLLSMVKDPDKRRKTVEKYVRLLGVHDHRHKFPRQLSGGLRQRVAIARALAPNPSLLLLDEPFSALDLPSKEKLRRDLLKIIREQNKTVILVTHDIDEAIFLSDRILVLHRGSYELVEVRKKNQGLKEYLLDRLSSGG